MPDTQPMVQHLVQTLGVAEAARQLKLTPNSVLRLAAGLPVRAGTLAHAAAQLGLLAPAPLAISFAPLPTDNT
jgi:hypothetical protein